MSVFTRCIILLLGLAVTGGCVSLPMDPRGMVLPAPGKSFDQFRAEDAVCRQWAEQRIGLSPQEIYNANTAAGALAGSAVGAGLGAAIGSASGNAGAGAAIGAASGLIAGAASGSNAGQVYSWEAQRRYDIAYQQCMYAYGNQLPAAGQKYRTIRRAPPPPPPPNAASPELPPPAPSSSGDNPAQPAPR